MRAQPTHSIATANRMAWKKYKELIRDATGERDQPYAMLQENVTNHASDRGGMSCSPTEARVQLEVVILGMISWSVSYIMAVVSYEIPPLLDCMGFRGPPGSKSRSWRGRGRWGTPDSLVAILPRFSRSTNLIHSAEKSYKNFLILARYSVTPIHGCVRLVTDEVVLTIFLLKLFSCLLKYIILWYC